MEDEPRASNQRLDPASDDLAAHQRVNDVALTLAGLLGRQIAREEFERRQREAAAQSDTPPQDDQPKR